MQLTDIENGLRHSLVNKFLKSSAHFHLMPAIRVHEMQNLDKMVNPKPSSVLILLFEKDQKVYFVVTQRQMYDGIHSGQISLPGGKADSSDINAEYTALRETWEEIGIESHKLEVIGQLSDLYIPPSNFIVSPFVAICREIPMYIRDETEVAQIVEIDLDMLMDDSAIKSKQFVGGKSIIEAPYFDIGGVEIWGATAMILSEFKSIIEEILIS